MKRLYAVGAIALLALLVAGFGRQTVPASKNADGIYSSNMILIDLTDHEVVSEIGSTERIYPASLTKMMTAIVSIENIKDVDEKVTMPEDIFDDLKQKNASVAGFEPGETVTAGDLLYGMILPSGADAAVGMACHIAGSEAQFVAMMNDKAKSLGMKHTHFTNVTGLHDDNHYSTLSDLSELLEYALKNETFRKVFTTSVYETTKTKAHPNGLVLESTLFSKVSIEALEELTILGGKTGFTDKAGLCLATLATNHQKEYILITANAKGKASTNPFHILDAINIYCRLTN